MENLLEVKNLQFSFRTYGGVVKAVRDVSFEVRPGEILGIVGESGCGKSVTSQCLMRLNPEPPGFFEGGEILYKGKDVLKMNKKELRQFRGKEISYIFQDPMTSLDPAFSVGEQIAEVLRVQGMSAAEKKAKALEILKMVGISDGERRYKQYPHELSGGMKQRVLLAQALLGDPKILILDEPTAGLDPKERISIRNYIAELSKDKIILFATHVVSDIECIADKVLLLKSGEIIATGTPVELIESMAGKVGEITCTLDEVGELQKEYKIGNIRQRKNGLALRVVGDKLPEEAVKVEDNIDLEDVYLYYFE